MVSEIDLLKKQIGDLFQCDSEEGFVRITTPFLYPDGDNLELDLEETKEGWVLSDYGEAFAWLWMGTARDHRTAKQNQMIGDICRQLAVELGEGELVIRLSSLDYLADAVFRLGQATIRVMDAEHLTKPLRKPNINDRIDRYFRQHKVEFTRYESLRGGSGKERLVSFRVRYPERESLVITLSPSQPSIAHGIAEVVSQAWKDLKHLQSGSEPLQFVSLLDDTRIEWNGADIRLLEDDSEIAFWSKPEAFRGLLMGERSGLRR